MTEYSWRDVNCPICADSSLSHIILECKDRLTVKSQTVFTLRKCKECGLVILSPQLDNESLHLAYEADGYDPFQSLQSPASFFDHIYRLARDFTLTWKKNLIAKLITPGSRLLDGGCGTGEFLNHLKSDYQVEGYEPERKVAMWVQQVHQLKIHAGNSSDLPADLEKFDIITLWHVLEHVPDPAAELNLLNKLLNPGGKVLIAVPNITSADSMIYGSNWVALDAPRHLWHFSLKQIDALAGKTGFKLQKTGMLPLDVYYNCLLSERLCITNKSIAQILLTPFRMPVTVLLSLLYGLATGRHSSNYYVLEKK